MVVLDTNGNTADIPVQQKSFLFRLFLGSLSHKSSLFIYSLYPHFPPQFALFGDLSLIYFLCYIYEIMFLFISHLLFLPTLCSLFPPNSLLSNLSLQYSIIQIIPSPNLPSLLLRSYLLCFSHSLTFT